MFYDEPFSLTEFSSDFLLTGIIGEIGPKLAKEAPILLKNLVVYPNMLGVHRLDEVYKI